MKKIKALMQKYPGKIMLPKDLAIEVNGKRKEISLNELPIDNQTFDIGSETVDEYTDIINDAQSIVVSGPMGVYENKEFAFGTKRVLKAIATQGDIWNFFLMMIIFDEKLV